MFPWWGDLHLNLRCKALEEPSWELEGSGKAGDALCDGWAGNEGWCEWGGLRRCPKPSVSGKTGREKGADEIVSLKSNL